MSTKGRPAPIGGSWRGSPTRISRSTADVVEHALELLLGQHRGLVDDDSSLPLMLWVLRLGGRPRFDRRNDRAAGGTERWFAPCVRNALLEANPSLPCRCEQQHPITVDVRVDGALYAGSGNSVSAKCLWRSLYREYGCCRCNVIADGDMNAPRSRRHGGTFDSSRSLTARARTVSSQASSRPSRVERGRGTLRSDLGTSRRDHPNHGHATARAPKDAVSPDVALRVSPQPPGARPCLT